MNPDANPYRRLLRTTAVMGSATVVNLAISVVRMKVLAVLLGPGGLGLMALYNSVLSSAVALFGAGLGFSGVKHVAQMPPESADLYRARLVLWYGSLGLGVLAAVVLWIFNAQIAEWAIGDRTHGTAVGCVGIGVIFSLLASSQTAVLQGQRKIAELVKVQVFSGALSAACAVVIVLWLKSDGIVAAVLAGPVVGALVGFAYLGRTPCGVEIGRLGERAAEFRLMLNLGLLFMANSIVAQLSEVWVRAFIRQEYGLAALGHYQAAWVISQSYIGIVLAAITTEFLPRISAAVSRRESVAGLVNEQVGTAFVVTTPVILMAMAFAPLIVPLLFSDEFAGAMPVLRWQLFGDLLRIVAIPLVYVLAAYEHKLLYLLVPTLWQASYICALTFGAAHLGLEGAGVAYLISHAIYVLAASWAVWRTVGVRLANRVLRIGAGALGMLIITSLALEINGFAGGAVGLACVFGWVAIHVSLKSR